ncbi:nucleotidyltransferase domain-containing protein [soil metagenome]
MLDLDARYLKIIKAILKEYVAEYEVHVFGSRVTGKAKLYSDIDLLLKGNEPLEWRRLESLKDAFSESNLPISVDVVDWNTISAEFAKMIASYSQIIQESSPPKPHRSS